MIKMSKSLQKKSEFKNVSIKRNKKLFFIYFFIYDIYFKKKDKKVNNFLYITLVEEVVVQKKMRHL